MHNPPPITPICFSENLQLSITTMDRLKRQQEFRLKNQSTFDQLSKREVEILTLVCQGKTNQEIGAIIFRAKDTVRTHRNNIWRRLRIRTVVEAVWWGEGFDLV